MKAKTIGLPVIRYEESGWEFIRRLASRYWLPVIPDETADKPVFSVGMKLEGSAPEQGFFKKEYVYFDDIGRYNERRLKDRTAHPVLQNYSGMEVYAYNNYNIGMSVTYRGKNLYICAKRARMDRSELVFTYVLGSRELYAPEPRHHEKLHGRSLNGTVVKCENETVKIQLDIDRNSENTKAEEELYAFPWQPDTGNLMYCMPEKDTIVTLYIGSINEGEAIAIHSLRNGKEKNIGKPENRYLTTKDKKRMFLKAKEMGYSLEDKVEGKTHFILKDENGITFRTNRKLVIQAKGKLKIAGDEIQVQGKKAVNIWQNSAGVEMIRNKINVKGKMTYLGFGIMGETADQADKLTLKKKERDKIKEKSMLIMTSGRLEKNKEKGYTDKQREFIRELYKLEQTEGFRQPIKDETYRNDGKMEKKIVLYFDNNFEGEKSKEFSRQLKNQEGGLNKLTVAEILLNKYEYYERKRAAIERGVPKPNGRSSEGSKSQKATRNVEREMITEKKKLELFKDFKKRNNRVPNHDEIQVLKNTADNYAESEMSTMAALHDPDQVAGGYGTNISGIGDSGVNSSIGKQWDTKNNADDMEDELWDYVLKNDVKAEECMYLFPEIELKEN